VTRGILAANRAVLGQLECPVDRQPDRRCETLRTEVLTASTFLASNTIDGVGVTHLCRELQIAAQERQNAVVTVSRRL